MKNVDPNVKRNIQTSIVNNLKSGVHWWALMALRQVMIPIVIKEERVLLWRDGYLNILTKEIKDFKQRYIVQKAPVSSIFASFYFDSYYRNRKF